jgi:hypothetical protein
VLLWFVATSVLTIHYVFTDPRFDHRPLVVGALLPDLIDAPFGGARIAHSITFSVGLLAVVMLVTAGRRPVRKRLIAVPIGMMLHLVFDGAWAADHVFWWPFLGGFGDTALPVVSRGWWNLALEGAGAALLWWSWRRFGLADRTVRRRVLHTGELG